ncbi:MAG: glycosyltransferase family 2 protein [bacterium]|nr:glycosyltransferase family 2 protein [bacterium]
MNLSAAIIARDASSTLSAAIKSIKSLAGEIVVIVDPRTTDETILLAKSLGAKVYQRKFDDFASQKNYAAAKCRGDWILSLDADETVSKELAEEIEQAITSTQYHGYTVPRLNSIWGKPINHTNWEPAADTHVWLWRKKSGTWVGAVHEEVMVEGIVGKLKHYKLHQNYQTVEQFMTKMNDYTDREAVAANPLVEFGRRYIWHFGFLDGWHGLFLSYLQAISHVVVWIKLWEKKNSRLPSS